MDIQQIRLSEIAVDKKANPRQHAPTGADKDLAANIKQVGVLQPICLRPNLSNGKGHPYLVVFGHRRFAAAQEAGLETIPATITEMTDAQALEASVVENLQREDIHWLDEAKGFAMLKANGLSQEDIAARTGCTLGYIASRLNLVKLIKPLEKLAYADLLGIGVAFRLSRVTAAQQKEFLTYSSADSDNDFYDSEDDNEEDDRTPQAKPAPRAITADEVDRWLKNNVYLRLDQAPFLTTDATLVPKAGACTTFPKSTAANGLLFAEFKGNDTCTDPKCFEAKGNALVNIELGRNQGAVKIVSGRSTAGDGVLTQFDYYSKGGPGYRDSTKDACPNTVLAVITAGNINQLGRLKYVCTSFECVVHTKRGEVRTPKKLGEINPERAKQQEELWQRRTSLACRIALHAAVIEKQQKLAAKAKVNETVPLELLRAAVERACSAMRPQTDGREYLEKAWQVPKPKELTAKERQKAYEDRDYGRLHESPMDALIAKADQSTLLRLLLDFSIADDVADKFATNAKDLDSIAKAYGVDVKAVTSPIQKEWDAKKKVSYDKRDERLKKERAKLAKEKGISLKAKPAKDPHCGAAVKPKAAKKDDPVALMVHELHTNQVCRFCGCSEHRACVTDLGPCSWIVAPKKQTKAKAKKTGLEYSAGVCSNPKCVLAFEAAKKEEKSGKASAV